MPNPVDSQIRNFSQMEFPEVFLYDKSDLYRRVLKSRFAVPITSITCGAIGIDCPKFKVALVYCVYGTKMP